MNLNINRGEIKINTREKETRREREIIKGLKLNRNVFL
jgi:hypothetical protein